MTTIAMKLYKNKLEVAADTFVSGGWAGPWPKFRVYKDYVFAAAGKMGDVQAGFNWIKDTIDKGEPFGPCPLKKKTPELLIWGPKTGILWYESNPTGLEYTGEYIAIGSGYRYAFGALAIGATAKRSIEVAAELDEYTKLPAASLTVHFGEGKIKRVVD